jgi:hypothetical protein
MRPSLIARGVSATAAVLLLSACGGGSDEEAASETTASSSSSAPAETTSAAPEADSEFCTQAAGIDDRIGSSFTEASDPQTLTENLQTAAREIRTIEPPDEIATDWASLADGLDSAAGALDGVDLTDPEAAARVQADLQELQGQLETSGANVEAYLSEQCGIDTGSGGAPGSESAAPSS